MGKLIPNKFILGVVIFVALGSCSCAYGLAIIGSTIGQPSFYKSLKLTPQGEPGYSRTAAYIGGFNGTFSDAQDPPDGDELIFPSAGISCAGSAFGSCAVSYLADKYSRKHTIQLGAIILSIGAAICGGSVDNAMFLVGRLINGFGIGLLVTCIPMYLAEVSTPECRGFMVSMHGIMFALGYTLSAFLGFGVSFISTSGSPSSFPWRFPIAFQMLPALIMLAGSKFLPYSPRWLMMQGRVDEAHDVIKRLHQSKDDTHATLARQEFYQIKKQVELDREMIASSSSFEIFKTAPNRRRLFVGCTLMFLNVWTGSGLIANYGVILYTQLGMTGYMPLLLTSLWVLVTFPGNTFCAFYVEKFGRRRFLLIGLSGILICLVCEAAIQAKYIGTSNHVALGFGVFFIFLFICPFWSTFMDATQFVYISEIFPTHIRSQGMGLSMFALFASSTIALCAGPTALNEDINALFGEKVAIHMYGATEAEKEEFEQAVLRDEQGDFHMVTGESTDIDDSKNAAERVEHLVQDETV
ncbi:hypothetical protein LTR84_010673 [Exophiala bonariae]|uniref:Major facilitator superfamily (MFS) profile domain-containing protein n=1 Tax=Exophiala bonariae TaxID=1690606 RepID=A0AAV9MVK4_9EURO|nr:hypothetical protein LTR84_010673 [Exophiala bonariae]